MKIFENIVGQAQVIEILRSAAIAAQANSEFSQKMTHSWLFTGPPGSEKSLAAKVFAAALVCRNVGCGVCIDCKTAMNGSHLDVEIYNVKGSMVNVNFVRDLKFRSSFKPLLSAWRIIILHDVDRLTESAANALLKNVEEPGQRTIWILSAPSFLDVLPTIRSRCRQIQFRTLNSKSTIAYLSEQDDIDQYNLAYIARTSRNNLDRVDSLKDSINSKISYEKMLTTISSIKDISSAFKAAESLIELASSEILDNNYFISKYELIKKENPMADMNLSLTKYEAKAKKEYDKNQEMQIKIASQELIVMYLHITASIYINELRSRLGISNSNLKINNFDQSVINLSKIPTTVIIEIINEIFETSAKISQGTLAKISLEKVFCEMLSL